LTLFFFMWFLWDFMSGILVDWLLFYNLFEASYFLWALFRVVMFAVLGRPEWAKRPCIGGQTRKVRIFFCLFYLYFGKEEASCILWILFSKASSLANQHRLHIYMYMYIYIYIYITQMWRQDMVLKNTYISTDLSVFFNTRVFKTVSCLHLCFMYCFMKIPSAHIGCLWKT